jgi:hypothetical protein
MENLEIKFSAKKLGAAGNQPKSFYESVYSVLKNACERNPSLQPLANYMIKNDKAAKADFSDATKKDDDIQNLRTNIANLVDVSKDANDIVEAYLLKCKGKVAGNELANLLTFLRFSHPAQLTNVDEATPDYVKTSLQNVDAYSDELDIDLMNLLFKFAREFCFSNLLGLNTINNVKFTSRRDLIIGDDVKRFDELSFFIISKDVCQDSRLLDNLLSSISWTDNDQLIFINYVYGIVATPVQPPSFQLYEFEYSKNLCHPAAPTTVTFTYIKRSTLLALLSASYAAAGGGDGKTKRGGGTARRLLRKADVTQAAVDLGLDPKGTIDEVLGRVAILQRTPSKKIKTPSKAKKQANVYATIRFCR